MTTPTDRTAIEATQGREYTCTVCGETKRGTEFRWKGFKRDSYCKPCRRAKDRERYKNSNGAGKDKVFDHSLRHLYGINLTQYNAMLAEQEHRCALCGEKPGSDRRMHVDHCHATGKIRALLCHHCNLLLGNAKDSTDRLRQAIAYLDKHASGLAARLNEEEK
ncbi:recombination endonuclease VII [Streptomyces sp. Amel2xB2]|uniref:endonuclease domain-containing protein n=1 Tax=Streptomyces sp. Amel2xB2 TaxID=1305829 RepID=UPI000DB998DE|nr:endonuclease domain-containing protein [Streptomyces sp. Amel2xB2]RAJ70314.1 recombination endonuclease VII [Streptomyces sp. Amel2xB2]